MTSIITSMDTYHPEFSKIPNDLFDKILFKFPKFSRTNEVIDYFRDLCRTDMNAPYYYKKERSGNEVFDTLYECEKTDFREDKDKRKRVEITAFITGWPDHELGVTRALLFDIAMNIYSSQKAFTKWGFNTWEKNKIADDDEKWAADKGLLPDQYRVSPDMLNIYPEKFVPLVGVAASVPMDTNQLTHYDPLKMWVGFATASDVDEGRPMRVMGFYMGGPKTKEPWLPFCLERKLPDGEWKADHEFYCDPHTVRVATKAEVDYLLGVGEDPWLDPDNFAKYKEARDLAVHNGLFTQQDADYWADDAKTYARLMAESCAPNPFEVGRCRQLLLPGSMIPILKRSQYATEGT